MPDGYVNNRGPRFRARADISVRPYGGGGYWWFGPVCRNQPSGSVIRRGGLKCPPTCQGGATMLPRPSRTASIPAANTGPVCDSFRGSRVFHVRGTDLTERMAE